MRIPLIHPIITIYNSPITANTTTISYTTRIT